MRLPYPGLRPFTRDESDLFFGREGCVDQMVDRLAATRFLSVLGPSGSGKSSLVITGLLDALEMGLCAAAGSRWRVAHMRPGSRPTENLAHALLRPAYEVCPISNLDLELLSSYLRRGPRSIAEWCADGNLPIGTNLLILVDQFEELFRYSDYASREEAEAFVALLLESARPGDAAIYVTITMRSENLGACALIPGLAERINAGLYLVPRMMREEVRHAIEGPAGACGFSIEPALVNRLLNDLVNLASWDDDPGTDDLQRLSGRADQLPLMQHVLNRMWLRVTEAEGRGPIELLVADYDRVGGLTGALDAHAREVFESLAESDRPVVETMFRALVSGTTIENAVRRPCRFRDLVALTDRNREAVVRVVDAFRGPECNFLTPSQDIALVDDTVIDISHESLIRQWSTLRDWVREEFQSAQTYRHIETTAHLWRKGQAGLLTMPYLGLALAWRRRERPNAAWATRYGGEWELALRFLDASGRRRALRRRAFAGLVGLVVLLSGAFGAVQFHKAKTSEDALATAQSNLNQVQQDLAKARSQLQDINLSNELTDFGVPQQETLQRNVGANTPRTIPGGIVVATKDLGEIINNIPPPILIDALEGPHLSTIPGAVRIPFAGRAGDWSDQAQRQLKVRLDNLTNGNLDATLVFFCAGAQCWESYNASLRAMHAGYRHVYWYRGGLASWQEGEFKTQNLFAQVQELKEKLTKSVGIHPKARWALAVSLSEAGDMMLNISSSYIGGATAAQQAARDELHALVTSVPENIDFLSDLATTSVRLGSAFEKQKMSDMAVAAYRDVDLVQRRLAVLAEKEPNTESSRSDIAGIDIQIGTAYYERGKFAEALDAFHAAEGLDKALSLKEPANFQYKNNLWVDLDHIGDILIQQGLLDEGLAAYRDAANIARAAVEEDATNSALKNDLGASADRIGSLAYRLVEAKDFEKALDAADFAISLVPAAVWIHGNRAHALMFLGRVDEARKVYLEFRGKKAHGEKSWEDMIAGDFADLRKHGLSQPLMDELEKIFEASAAP
jgi:PQQ-dependent catabolism-associated CXXCW motif protein